MERKTKGSGTWSVVEDAESLGWREGRGRRGGRKVLSEMQGVEG